MPIRSATQKRGSEIPGALVVSLLAKRRSPMGDRDQRQAVAAVFEHGRATRRPTITRSTLKRRCSPRNGIGRRRSNIGGCSSGGEAFTGFLDEVLSKSPTTPRSGRAAERSRVREHLPALRRGVHRQHAGAGRAKRAIDLEATFNATLTFLYRLMFVLYAESLEPAAGERRAWLRRRSACSG